MNFSAKNKVHFVQALLTTMGLLGHLLLLQAQTGQRFKQIDYTYDLISGKVNEVHYQASQPDAFYHRYEYDADNRIINVFTSNDSIIWDNDARYVYYAHGPLARAELGDNNVQGMDYAYTLQGWIKGVNSNLLQAENDIGNDGLTGSPNSLVAKDAFGYSLNYHTDDYKPIDGPKWSNTVQRFEALTPGSDLMASRFDLFNGNISSMVTTIEEPRVYTGAPNELPNELPQGTAYKYDQLNRLLEMKAFQNLGTDPSIPATFNKWQPGSTYTGLYHNAFKYDANGNILYQERADQNGAAFDKLAYQYKTDANGKRLQNRLYHVNDGNTNTTIATDDIEDQGAFTPSPTSPISINDVNNYRYDEIGNLKHDTQEGIDKIEWTVYGKIKSITRVPGNLSSDLEFLYDATGNRIAKIEKPRDASGVKPPGDWTATYYTRDAQGNVMGIYKLTAVTTGQSFKVVERHVYGSSRLGSDYSELEMVGASALSNPVIKKLGNKHFEGSNHLGNVLAVFSDRKISKDDDGDGVIDYFQPQILSVNDYAPFGAPLNGRTFTGSTGYRYGFNGEEKDDAVKGNGDSYDFGARIFDPRLGRWLALDPLKERYPAHAPYSFGLDNPIFNIDPDGGTVFPYFASKQKEKEYKAALEQTNKDAVFRALFSYLDKDYNLTTKNGKKGFHIVSVTDLSQTEYNEIKKDSGKGEDFDFSGVTRPFPGGSDQDEYWERTKIQQTSFKYSNTYEELFHAGQNQFYGHDKMVEQNDLSREVEAKIAKIQAIYLANQDQTATQMAQTMTENGFEEYEVGLLVNQQKGTYNAKVVNYLKGCSMGVTTMSTIYTEISAFTEVVRSLYKIKKDVVADLSFKFLNSLEKSKESKTSEKK